jgi:hypothetical protein
MPGSNPGAILDQSLQDLKNTMKNIQKILEKQDSNQIDEMVIGMDTIYQEYLSTIQMIKSGQLNHQINKGQPIPPLLPSDILFDNGNQLQRVASPSLMQEYRDDLQVEKSLPIQRVIAEKQVYPTSSQQLPPESERLYENPSRPHRESVKRPFRYRDEISKIETVDESEVYADVTSTQLNFIILTAGHHDKDGHPLNFRRCVRGDEKAEWFAAAVIEYKRLLTETKTMKAIKFTDKPTNRTASYYNPQCSTKIKLDKMIYRVRGTYGGECN